MKKIIDHIKQKLLAGLIFLIPLFALLLLLQKLWTFLSGSGHYLAKLLGMKPVLGTNPAPIITSFLLVLLVYLCGWVVNIKAMNSSMEWIETRLLQYIPGYLPYKAQLTKKLGGRKTDNRIPVWVMIPTGKRPGLLVEEANDQAVVFFPNSPDSNNGEVLLVPGHQIIKLDITPEALFKSLQNFGKNLLQEPAYETSVSV